ncbi:hypothetical protein C8J35_1772, partial [Rhizobium sp. PP-F2F-G38]
TPPAIHTFTPAGKAIMTHPGPAKGRQGCSDQGKRNFRCTLTAAAALNRDHTDFDIQLYYAAVVVA